VFSDVAFRLAVVLGGRIAPKIDEQLGKIV
jgi:hypothetical protein